MTILAAHVVLRHLHHLAAKPEGRQPSDDELLGRFVAGGDEAAFAALVGRHGPVVLSVCRAVLSHTQDAEDVFQATFLVLAKKAASIRKRSAVGSWLHGVALRLARRAKADRINRREAECHLLDEAPAAGTDDLSRRELRSVLHEEIGRLPEKYRLPLLLCYWESRTQEEAARQLGCPKGTLRDRVERARELLKSRLVRRGLAPPAALVAAALSRESVSAALVRATTRAAAAFAAGKAAAVSARTASLAEGGVQAMNLAKLKVGAALVLALSLFAAGLAAHHTGPAPTPQAGPPEAPKPAAPDGGPAVNPAERTDRHGDPLPPGAFARLGTARFRHGGTVEQIAFSPDGKTLVSACGDLSAYLWDATTGRVIRRLPQATAGFAATFSPDGKRLATGLTEEVLLWDPATGKRLAGWKLPPNVVRRLAFSPDGKTLAAFEQNSTVHFLDAATGEERHRLKGAEGNYSNFPIALAPDSRTFTHVTSEAVFRLHETATGKEVRVFKGHEKEVEAVAFSPDGKTLASRGRDETIRFWEAETGKEVLRVKDAAGPGKLAFTPDGKALVVAGGGLRLLEAATGKPLREFEWEAGEPVESLAVSPDGQTVAASRRSSHAVSLWDTATGRRRGPSGGHEGAVHAVAFLPDGKTLLTGANEPNWTSRPAARLWDLATGKEVGQLGERLPAGYALAVAPDGKTVAVGKLGGPILLLDRATGKEVGTLAGHEFVLSLAFSADGKRLASRGSGADQTIRVWDLTAAKGQKPRDRGPEGPLPKDPPGGPKERPPRNPDPGFDVGPPPPGEPDPAPGPKELCRIAVNPGGAGQVALSPDGTFVAEAGGSVGLWDAGTGRLRHSLAGGQGGLHSVAFSPDGRLLAAGDAADGAVRLWDVATGAARGRLEGHKGRVGFVAFSPDGRTLASGGDDQTVRLWEVATGQERGRFDGGQFGIRAGAFSPDGRAVASGARDTTVLVWDVTGRGKDGRPARNELPEKEREAAWADLAGEDAPKAYRAVWALAAAPEQAVPFLKDRLLGTARPIDAKRARQLIQELDEDDFPTREKATRELGEMGEAVEPALRDALEGKPSAEARRRLELLLAKLSALSPPQLRGLRAVEALEQIGTPEARRALEALVKERSSARLAREAKASLERLAGRPRG